MSQPDAQSPLRWREQLPSDSMRTHRLTGLFRMEELSARYRDGRRKHHNGLNMADMAIVSEILNKYRTDLESFDVAGEIGQCSISALTALVDH
ncbi:MAG: hypothetical protein AAF497_19975 [Planctomycetota bacterium]